MISFSSIDIFVILLFFAALLFIGFYSSRKMSSSADDFLLSGRNVGLFLFVLTNVSTWYGGIIGVGEFTYRYGILSWFTQGLPYYLFAFLFALFFADKIRNASLFTIPDKIRAVYGSKAALLSSLIVFILVSPAPYLLMSAQLIQLAFGLDLLPALIISIVLSASYLIKGGFRANIFADAFQFFVMFGGFILIFLISYFSFGGFEFLQSNVPKTHLEIGGGVSPVFILVWFLIAMWTFADPGFHQRCYAAKSGSIAKKGIIISIVLWAAFDFLTTSTGLYAKAIHPELSQPMFAFPMLAETVLGPGLKGIFYAALFATILSTLNSFFFLSATTISRDFIFQNTKRDENLLKKYTIVGLIISGFVSVIIALTIPSVVEIWYTIGSFFIPGIIIPVISSYYLRIRIDNRIILIEIILSISASVVWYFIRIEFSKIPVLNEIEPMIVGLFTAVLIHAIGLLFSFKDE